MNLKHTFVAGAAILALASCEQKTKTTKTDRKLLDPANMDTTVRPGDNFFLYANGAWLSKNPIPGSETRWGSFNELQEGNYKALHELLEGAAGDKNAKAGSATQKVGDIYRTGMDSAAIDKAGITPMNEVLSRINAIQDANGILNEVALEHTQGIGQLFGVYVAPDDKNVTKNITQFYQGGLGMPDRDYYFKTDERTAKIREAYKVYLVKMLGLMGEDSTTAQKDAADIYKLETALAGASMTRVEMRDPYKLYNKFSLDGISQQTPGIDWKAMATNLKISGQDSVIVGMPAFFKEVAKQLKATPVPVWKKYLSFHAVNDMSPYLSSNFDNTHFDFYGKTVRGQQEQKPRWKRVLNVADGSVGELLGQMYVDKNFKPEAKERMLALVNNLLTTYGERIKRLDWMSETTKQKALGKLNTFIKKIGYPDKWKDYSKLTIVGDNYVKNIIAASAFEYDYMINKLGKPVDKTEWQMTPPTVNAYYNPAFNEIVFPAGILQYPFFDMDADDAVNYGGIGAVIGHEVTHGFDDQGRQYDADGNLHDWWTPEDAAKFTQKAGVVISQFDSYTVLDSTHVNGNLTLGENLADLGGLAIAYEAFKKTEQGKSTEKIDGFTPDQRFFLSWAQVWRANTRDEEMANRVMTDPHSPNLWRCNGPLSNMPEFYQAFNVQPGDKMYRPDSLRAKVW
ncbi:M13 family metallopeptidase [Polluticoccus soli]|uniref:M13 family metallopeptidase n=1 Tax=Polluticoccus soli TaxID=3034150 RepID=UPI0023E0B108|nr:M13 family metallopeptidase [Flavipsychrobacter sp. JY13-12]